MVIFRKGSKINLRPIEKSDVPKLVEWVNDEETTRYLSIYLPMNTFDEENWVESLSKNKSTDIVFGIESLKEKELIGNIGLHQINSVARKANLGIFIGEEEYRGKGYGTEAIKKVIEYAFLSVNLRKITLSVLSFNERAKKCYKKCGFQVEGVFKEGFFKEGEYVDEIFMSIFRKDWQKQ
ncbi:MAG: GNAT family N-acetyltransferase [Candidatus Pacebacteria bacterium]|nr:GNAT family N-acetyltransferase [Candidatus Paceibacterota bacterium]